MGHVHIKVRVKTGAKNEIVLQHDEDNFEISVREKPKNNLANRRVIELIAAQCGTPASRVHIIKGHRQPSKILSVNSK